MRLYQNLIPIDNNYTSKNLDKSLDEMKKLFVVSEDKSNESYEESSIIYTVSGKTSDEVVDAMEKGIDAID